VISLADSRPIRITTLAGEVAAARVVLAVSAWAASLPALKRFIIAVGSDVIATEPIGDRLKRVGIPTGVAISDSRRLVHYYRTTEDGRFIFGKGGAGLAFAGRIGNRFGPDEGRAAEVLRQFKRTYPVFGDVEPSRAWRGAVDYSLSGLPFIGELQRGGLYAATGFSGNGVGPSLTAGEGLAQMMFEREVTSVPDGLRQIPVSGFPPEPLRSLGGRLVRVSVARKEAVEDRGRRPSWPLRIGAALDPTGFVDL
jgi:glycine/D-amino acid oxidase-like deaminating enzyme